MHPGLLHCYNDTGDTAQLRLGGYQIYLRVFLLLFKLTLPSFPLRLWFPWYWQISLSLHTPE